MNDRLVVIYCSEDGDKSLERYTKEEFAQELDGMIKDGEQPEFAKAGENPDLDSFVGYIVIEGDIIEPKRVKTVTKYKF